MKHNYRFLPPFFFALLIVVYAALSVSPVLALGEKSQKIAQADTNSTATNSATTEELKKRIEKVVEEKREQIKGVLDDLLVKKAGYVGEITRISGEALTIKSRSTTTIVPLAQDLVILQDNKPLSVDKIEVGNWAVIVGDKDGELVEAEFILVSDTTLRPRNQLVTLARISSINKNDMIIIPRGSEEERKLTIQKTTKFQDTTGEVAAPGLFEKDLNVLIIGLENQTGWELKTVRSLAPLKKNTD